MMSKHFEESGYLFDFSNSTSALVADVPQLNGLSAIDFIVEAKDEILFIEVKNPDNSKATTKAKLDFLKDLSDDMYPHKINLKYRDTILREWACGKIPSKPIICIFILEFTSFTAFERERLKNKIFDRLPFSLNKFAPKGRKHLHGFELLTIDEFRNKYSTFLITKVP
ncbi:MAG: hypothetical protein FWE57_05220 [Chitinispirillia bacterium]|nr:hypothetical protein [Chitinispirillia bacterium]